MTGELLLTEREIYFIILNRSPTRKTRQLWGIQEYPLEKARIKPSRTELALIEAQLAKAKRHYEGVIRQDEKKIRERIFEEIESKLLYIALDYDGKPVLHLQTNGEKSAEKWLSLKGEK